MSHRPTARLYSHRLAVNTWLERNIPPHPEAPRVAAPSFVTVITGLCHHPLEELADLPTLSRW